MTSLHQAGKIYNLHQVCGASAKTFRPIQNATTDYTYTKRKPSYGNLTLP